MESSWPPVYRLPSLAQLRLWLEIDQERNERFLTKGQRIRFRLRLVGVDESRWPPEAWRER